MQDQPETTLQREQIAKAARSFYSLANDLAANGAVLPSQAALALATAGAHALRDVFGETLAAEMLRDIADLTERDVSRHPSN